jgi:hypothetical protein
MSLPGEYPLHLYRGDSRAWAFHLWDDPDKTEPTDLTGATAMSEVRTAPCGKVLFALDCTIEPPHCIDVALTADKWTGWDCTRTLAYWDLLVTYPGGETSTIVAGQVRVQCDVTESHP